MDVSRETMDLLRAYEAEVLKWNRTINLVSKATQTQFFERHIQDCLQVYEHRPKGDSWADLGSGGGLPGLVVAIAAKERQPDLKTTLVESDKRKSAFCRSAARLLGLNVKVLDKRIEAADPLMADIVSCRALAPLDVLLGYIDRHLAPDGTAIILKGENWEAEVTEALASWRFTVEKIPSRTNPAAAILKIGDIARA